MSLAAARAVLRIPVRYAEVHLFPLGVAVDTCCVFVIVWHFQFGSSSSLPRRIPLTYPSVESHICLPTLCLSLFYSSCCCIERIVAILPFLGRGVGETTVAESSSLGAALAAAEVMQQSSFALATRAPPPMPSAGGSSRLSSGAPGSPTTTPSEAPVRSPAASRPQEALGTAPAPSAAVPVVPPAAPAAREHGRPRTPASTTGLVADGLLLTAGRRTRARGGLFLAVNKYAHERSVPPPTKTIAKNDVLSNDTLGYVTTDGPRVRRVVGSAMSMFLPRVVPLCAQQLDRIVAAIEFVERREPRLRCCIGSWGACALFSRGLKNRKPGTRARRVIVMDDGAHGDDAELVEGSGGSGGSPAATQDAAGAGGAAMRAAAAAPGFHDQVAFFRRTQIIKCTVLQ